MLRPPRHRVDSPIVLIHESDDAWDHERILHEGTGNAEHAVRRYWRGESRFDLAADVQAYLKPDKQPTRFILRRLSWDDYQRVVQKIESGDARGAWAHACQCGLSRIENGPIVLEGSSPTYAEMQRLHDCSTTECDLVRDIGFAAYKASAPLSAAEKKA